MYANASGKEESFPGRNGLLSTCRSSPNLVSGVLALKNGPRLTPFLSLILRHPTRSLGEKTPPVPDADSVDSAPVQMHLDDQASKEARVQTILKLNRHLSSLVDDLL